jgi:hypothetical protein
MIRRTKARSEMSADNQWTMRHRFGKTTREIVQRDDPPALAAQLLHHMTADIPRTPVTRMAFCSDMTGTP